MKFHEQFKVSMIEESNKFLVFKYSTGVAVIEITIKEMPFSLSTAYLIKVGRVIHNALMKQKKVYNLKSIGKCMFV